jgi:hypothetical protein
MVAVYVPAARVVLVGTMLSDVGAFGDSAIVWASNQPEAPGP